VGVRVGVAPCISSLALSKKLKNLHAKSQLYSFYSFRDLCVHTDGQIGGQTVMARSTRLVFQILLLLDKSSIPFKSMRNGYKNNSEIIRSRLLNKKW